MCKTLILQLPILAEISYFQVPMLAVKSLSIYPFWQFFSIVDCFFAVISTGLLSLAGTLMSEPILAGFPQISVPILAENRLKNSPRQFSHTRQAVSGSSPPPGSVGGVGNDLLRCFAH